MSMLSTGDNAPGGQRQIIAVIIWVVVLIIGAGLVWWSFFGFSSDEEETPATAVPPTQSSGLIPLSATATPIPLDGGDPPTESPIVEPDVPLGEEVFGYGVQAQALISDPNYAMDQVSGLGVGWVKQQVPWETFEPNRGQFEWGLLDGVVDAANARGLRVMFSVKGAPNWSRTYFDDNPQHAPPDDLADFANFLGALVDRYKGRVHAIEVWNEQNLDREWDTATGVDSARYVEMLQMAYQAIKSRDPNIIVISGALSPVGGNGTDPNNPSRLIWMDDSAYYQEMIAQSFLSYCDCVGIHHNGYNIPPDVVWDDATYQDASALFRGYWDSPHPSWSFRSTLWQYHDAISGMKPLCVTEFGWASSEGYDGYPEGFGFAQDNTLQEQADFIVQAYQLMHDWGFVRLAFLWNLDYAQKDGEGATGPNAPYSIIDLYGVPRPAYWAVGGMDKPQ